MVVGDDKVCGKGELPLALQVSACQTINYIRGRINSLGWRQTPIDVFSGLCNIFIEEKEVAVQ